MSTARPAVTGYSLVKPPPWQRIELQGDVPAQVRAVVDRAVRDAPRELSPDELAPLRHRLEHRLRSQLDAARHAGGIDYYFPAGDVHGVQLNASFLVSTFMPSGAADPDLASAVLTELLETGSEAVPVGDTVWARADQVVAGEPDDLVGEPLPARKVEYATAVPGNERTWLLVTFTAVGDGDPDSELTHLAVELFDAMMTTWRWTTEVESP